MSSTPPSPTRLGGQRRRHIRFFRRVAHASLARRVLFIKYVITSVLFANARSRRGRARRDPRARVGRREDFQPAAELRPRAGRATILCSGHSGVLEGYSQYHAASGWHTAIRRGTRKPRQALGLDARPLCRAAACFFPCCIDVPPCVTLHVRCHMPMLKFRPRQVLDLDARTLDLFLAVVVTQIREVLPAPTTAPKYSLRPSTPCSPCRP
jgi:hypothetical protein